VSPDAHGAQECARRRSARRAPPAVILHVARYACRAVTRVVPRRARYADAQRWRERRHAIRAACRAGHVSRRISLNTDGAPPATLYHARFHRLNARHAAYEALRCFAAMAAISHFVAASRARELPSPSATSTKSFFLSLPCRRARCAMPRCHACRLRRPIFSLTLPPATPASPAAFHFVSFRCRRQPPVAED